MAKKKINYDKYLKKLKEEEEEVSRKRGTSISFDNYFKAAAEQYRKEGPLRETSVGIGPKGKEAYLKGKVNTIEMEKKERQQEDPRRYIMGVPVGNMMDLSYSGPMKKAKEELEEEQKRNRLQGYKNSNRYSDFEEYVKKGKEIENPTYEQRNTGIDKLVIGNKKVADFDIANRLKNKVEYAFEQEAKKNVDPNDYDRRYTKLTEEERNIYNYVLAKEGNKAADEYLKSLDRDLNKRRQESVNEGVKKMANENKFAGVAANIGSSFLTPAAYAETIKQNVKNKITGKEEEIDPYSSAMSPVHMNNATREGIEQNMSNGGKFMTDVGLSLLDYGAKVGTMGGAGALLNMAAGAAGSTAQDAAARGGDPDQVLQTSTVAGLAEYVTEKMGLERLIKFKTMPDTVKKRIVQEMVKGIGAEGSEEAVTEVINSVADIAVMGEKSNYTQGINSYMAQGLNEEEAAKRARQDIYKNVGLSFAGGALAGGVMNAAAIGIGRMTGSEIQEGKEIEEEKKKIPGQEPLLLEDNIPTNPEMQPQSQMPQNFEQREEIPWEEFNEPIEDKTGRIENTKVEKLAITDRGPAQVEQFVEVTPKDAIVRLDNGEVTSLGNINFRDPQTQDLFRFASTLDDKNAATSYVNQYNKEIPLHIYSEGYARFFNAGIRGSEDFETVYKKGSMGDMVPKHILYEAYALGEQKAARETKLPEIPRQAAGTVTDMRTIQDDTFNEIDQGIALKTGQDVVLKDSMEKGASGSFSRSMATFTFSEESKNKMMTRVHELGEFAESYNPEGMRKLQDAVLNWYSDTHGYKAMDEMIAQYQNMYQNADGRASYAQAAQEMTNDALGGLFSSDEGVEDFVNWIKDTKTEAEQKNIVQTIVDFFTQIVDKLKSYVNGIYKGGMDYIYSEMEADKAAKIRKRVLEAVDKAGIEYKNTEKTGENKKNPPTTGGVNENSSPLTSETVSGTDSNGSIAQDRNNIKPDDVRYQLNQFGFEEYTERQKKNWDNGKIVLCNTVQDIVDFAKAADGKVYKILYMGKIGPELAERIKGETGVDLLSYNVVLRSDNVIKIIKKHGGDKEHLRGQEKVTPEMFADIPKIISEFDSVELAGKTDDGKPALKFAKDINGKEVAIEYISDKRMMLYTQTMYATKKSRTTARDVVKHSPPLTSQTNSSSGSNNSIPQNEEDIKYQLKDTANTRDIMRENEKLHKAVEALKEEVKLSKGFRPSVKDVRKLAKDILTEYSSKYPLKSLEDNILKLVNYMHTAKDIRWDEIMHITSEVAKPVIEQSLYVDDTLKQQYKGMLDDFKKRPIKLSDAQKQEVSNVFGTYNDFRKANFGKLRVSENGTPLNTIWDELCGLYPEFFDTNTNEGDQIISILDAIETVQPQYYNEYSENMDQAAYDLALKIYDAYFDIGSVKTFADKQKDKLLTAQRKYRESVREIRKEEREKYKQKLAETVESNKENTKKIKEQQNEKIVKARAAVRESYAERNKRNKERTMASNSRAKIRKDCMELSKWLINPTDSKHVPEPLRAALTHFVSSIDLLSDRMRIDSKTVKNINEAMGVLSKSADELSKQLMLIEQGKNVYENFDLEIDPDFIYRVEQFIKDNSEERSIYEMDHKQLKELEAIVHEIKRSITQINTMIGNERYKKVSECGKDTINQLQEKKSLKKQGKILDLLNISMLDARSFFEQIGPAGMSIYNESRKGFNKKMHVIRDASDFMSDALKGINIKEITGPNAKVFTFEINGSEYKITTEMIMELYKLHKRGAAKKHILQGGIKLDDFIIKDGKNPILKTVHQTGEHVLTPQKIEEIISKLTPEEKKLADRMQEFMAIDCAEYGNETSMKLYGYEKFKDPNYYPIRTDSNSVKTSDITENNSSLYAIKNKGMTKNLVEGASNPIRVGSIFDTFIKHVLDMADYNAYAIPLIDAMKWYNYNNRLDVEEGEKVMSVKSELERVYGKGAKEYFIKLIQDINGATASDLDTKIAGRLISSYKAAAVGANLRVVVQQPTAIMRALAVMEPKYLIHARATRQSMKDVKKYSEIAYWKSNGYYDTMIGKSMKEIITGISTTTDKIKEKSLALAGFMDDVTWGAIWNACRYEIKEKHPDLTVDSKEYIDTVKQRFDDIIDQTQVVDTVLHRSQAMKNKDILVKSATSFMAEPTKSYNLLRNALINADKPGGKKALARAISVYVLTGVVTAAVASIADAFRDYDEFDSWGKKYFKSLAPNIISGLNPLNLIPFAKDVVSMIDGWSVNRMDMQSIQGIIYAVQGLSSDKKPYTKIKSLAKGFSGLSGLPIGNTMRTFESMYNLFSEENLGEPVATMTRKAELLYNAIVDENDEMKEKVLRLTEEKDLGELEKELTKITNKKMKEEIGEGEIDQAQEELNIVTGFKEEIGKNPKDIKSGIKSSLSGEFKPRYLEGETEIASYLKSLTYNGDALYTDKDFEKWKKDAGK